MGARRLFAVVLAATAVGLVLAAPAEATFHEMSIREIYLGSTANPNSQYVELQMWAAGQNHVASHTLRSFDPTGMIEFRDGFHEDVTRGENQSTLVLATPQAETQFGIKADATISSGGKLSPGSGAVCWESIDCVAWGSFLGGSLGSPFGKPAPAVPDGMALRRTIAPGCATLLEPGDDSDNSAADFAAVTPEPRPNSVAPVEHACGPVGGSGGGGSGGGGSGGGGHEGGGGSGANNGGSGGQGHRAPQTILLARPSPATHDRTPSFRFRSNRAGSSFECRVDRHAFKPCRSPFTTRRLRFGKHSFAVRAQDASGNVDPSPAFYAFRVVPRAQGPGR